MQDDMHTQPDAADAEAQAKYEALERAWKVPTLAERRAMTEDELVRRHDLVAAEGGLAMGPDDYLNELQRRENGRQTDYMVKLTKNMHHMTVFITIMTVVNIILVAWTIFD